MKVTRLEDGWEEIECEDCGNKKRYKPIKATPVKEVLEAASQASSIHLLFDEED